MKKSSSDSAAQHSTGESMDEALIMISNPNGWLEERDVCWCWTMNRIEHKRRNFCMVMKIQQEITHFNGANPCSNELVHTSDWPLIRDAISDLIQTIGSMKDAILFLEVVPS